jgi:hypothetical protein
LKILSNKIDKTKPGTVSRKHCSDKNGAVLSYFRIAPFSLTLDGHPLHVYISRFGEAIWEKSRETRRSLCASLRLSVRELHAKPPSQQRRLFLGTLELGIP